MKPLVFTLPWGFVLLAVLIWTFYPEFQILRRASRGAARPGSPDAGSTKLIMRGGGFGFWVGFALAFVPFFQFAPSLRVASFILGVAMIVSGSLLRRHCFRVLGQYFTGDVQARADQPVIERGAYAIVRHPSYTGGILMNVGMGFALGSWGSVLVFLLSGLIVYAYRIAVEERTLVATLGTPYQDYMRRHKRLIPYIY